MDTGVCSFRGKFAFIGSLRARADYLLFLGAGGETDEGVHSGSFDISRFTFNRCICLRNAGGKSGAVRFAGSGVRAASDRLDYHHVRLFV